MDGPHVRQPKGRRGEPLVIQGGSSPETRATCPLGESGGWNGQKPHGLLLLNMISFPTVVSFGAWHALHNPLGVLF